MSLILAYIGAAVLVLLGAAVLWASLSAPLYPAGAVVGVVGIVYWGGQIVWTARCVRRSHR